MTGAPFSGKTNRRCPVLKRGGLKSFGIVFWFQKTVLLGCVRYSKTKKATTALRETERLPPFILSSNL
jgi:hypothetical protein